MERQEEETATGIGEEETTVAASKCYPNSPVEEAVYQQLVENTDLFLLKLSSFHSSFGTNLTTPSIEGTTLNLHRLFVEVTSRGGLDKVVRDRKWEEVISAFEFPRTSISGSFLLRKYYVSLLYHFEQAYFFRKRVPPVAITDAVNQTPSVRSCLESTPVVFEESTMFSHFPAASPQIQPGISLVGIIDEKFENGYVVSVNVGSDQLKGILYHIPDRPEPSWSPNPCIPQRRKRKKSRLTLLDPSKPKSTRNSYTFISKHYATLKPMPQGQEKPISKNNGDLWNKSSEAEKQFYEDNEVQDEERDNTEIGHHKSSINL